MKKITILGIIVILLVVGLSGCISSNSNDESSGDAQSATTTYSSKLVYVNRDSQAKIEEACVEIQNTGENGAWFVVDFEFVVYDEENLGPGDYDGGGTTNYELETYHMEKQVYVEAHKTNRAYCQPWSFQPAISLHDYSVNLD